MGISLMVCGEGFIPVGPRSGPKSSTDIHLHNRVFRDYDCCAAERG